MSRFEIQPNPPQLKPIKREFRKQRKLEKKKNEIDRKFLINCLISGIYIYSGFLLNIYSYCKTLKFINTLIDFRHSEGLSGFLSAVKMLISVGGLVKFTAARYLIGYPFLAAGIVSVVLTCAAFGSMNGKTVKTAGYRIARIFADTAYFLPIVFIALFIWVMFIPL